MGPGNIKDHSRRSFFIIVAFGSTFEQLLCSSATSDIVVALATDSGVRDIRNVTAAAPGQLGPSPAVGTTLALIGSVAES